MNWGNRLLITFLVFGGGMTYLVYRCMHTNYELVEKDYYKTEIGYQQFIDGAKHAGELSAQPVFKQIDAGIQLQMPAEMKNKKPAGEVWFYCAYNSKQDKKISLNVNDEGIQLFSSGNILPGVYTVKISWVTEGKNYYSENNFTVH